MSEQVPFGEGYEQFADLRPRHPAEAKLRLMLARRVGISYGDDAERRSDGAGGNDGGWAHTGRPEGAGDPQGCGRDGDPGPTNGHWRAADWLYCRDEKWRPVEPGTFPLAHGAPARMGRLRLYGNAIVAQVAEEFIRAYLEVTTPSQWRCG